MDIIDKKMYKSIWGGGDFFLYLIPIEPEVPLEVVMIVGSTMIVPHTPSAKTID